MTNHISSTISIISYWSTRFCTLLHLLCHLVQRLHFSIHKCERLAIPKPSFGIFQRNGLDVILRNCVEILGARKGASVRFHIYFESIKMHIFLCTKTYIILWLAFADPDYVSMLFASIKNCQTKLIALLNQAFKFMMSLSHHHKLERFKCYDINKSFSYFNEQSLQTNQNIDNSPTEKEEGRNILSLVIYHRICRREKTFCLKIHNSSQPMNWTFIIMKTNPHKILI